MDPAMQRHISSRGGKAAHAAGRAHECTRDEAVAAGAKGCKAAQASGKGHKFTTDEARIAGSKGGQVRARQRRK
jgi:hypothetical protein